MNKPSKILYFDCFSGISGDMVIAALLDAGLKLEVVEDAASKLKLKGFKLKSKKVRRNSISGREFKVEVIKNKHFSDPQQIIDLIEKSKLEERVKKLSLKIFSHLIKAEKAVHQADSRQKIHLHEVGQLDSLIDVVGFAAGVCSLEIDEFFVSRVCLGKGMVETQHGSLPVPCPAALFLLKGLLVHWTDIPYELVTPTGAAILKVCLPPGRGETVINKVPDMEISRIGYGAGQRQVDSQPNMLRIMIGQEQVSKGSNGYLKDKVTVIETNIDDMEPLRYEYVINKLFDSGALDVYLTPVIMKKSRPAVVLTVLAPARHLLKITDIIFEETSTFGVRYWQADRSVLARKVISLDTEYGRVGVKAGYRNNKIIKTNPEYEDCARLARENKIPLEKIYSIVKHKPLFTISEDFPR